MPKKRKLRAIDLYSGVGGWSLGLTLAGIDVIASYERWGAANETNFKNNHHQAQTIDIRRLTFADLPEDIDIVVGSPPCTQFSYSNRGGNGDIDDGLEDIIKFLTIVDHIKPRAWAMENVPRMAGIIRNELKRGGKLKKFAHLGITPHIVNMGDYGLPQRRRRCMAGNFDFQLLAAYGADSKSRTLGEVITGLSLDPVIDSVFGNKLCRKDLTEQNPESPLNLEEERINRANKTTHPIYNAMPFPDPLDRTVRTITATCTRVSRESIIIETPEKLGAFRRLTLRERASLQGFPIWFQFYGANYDQKLRMIGNAIPPAFTYLVAHSFLGTPASRLPSINKHAKLQPMTAPKSSDTPPNRPGAAYQPSRAFRFAIPSLQLKSGVRFELRNRFEDNQTSWTVDFYFGTSKRILGIPLGAELLKYTERKLRLPGKLVNCLARVTSLIRQADIANLQTVWAHKGPGATWPFDLLDSLDKIGADGVSELNGHPLLATSIVLSALKKNFGKNYNELPGVGKLERNADIIATGLLLGSIANQELAVKIKKPVRRTVTKQRSARRT